nr:hypothetical protein [Candidatus Sigynarchaeota archaeon]
MSSIQELNRRFLAAVHDNEPSMIDVLTEICNLLESSGSNKVLAKALSLKSSILDSAGKRQDARDLYIKALAVLFKAGFSELFIDIGTRPTISPSDLRAIAGLEAAHAVHDFAITIDCDVPMYPWASSAVESMKTFFKTGAGGFSAQYKFIFLGKDKEETPFNKNPDTNFARLQVLNLPLVGKHMLTLDYLEKLQWPGFRKTSILIVNDTDITRASMKTVDSKRFFERMKAKLVKIHVIACGKFMADEPRQALEMLTDNTGGVFMQVDEPDEVGKVLTSLIAGDLGRIAGSGVDDISNKILEKEANVLWQWR